MNYPRETIYKHENASMSITNGPPSNSKGENSTAKKITNVKNEQEDVAKLKTEMDKLEKAKKNLGLTSSEKKTRLLTYMDKIAGNLEKTSPKLALQIDHISDEIERTADVIDYPEFLKNTGDVGIPQSDIENIETISRGYDVTVQKDTEKELNDLLKDVFNNSNFEKIRLDGNKWILTFKE